MVANVATIAMVKVWNGLNAPVRPLELCKVGDPYLVCDNQRGGKILVDGDYSRDLSKSEQAEVVEQYR